MGSVARFGAFGVIQWLGQESFRNSIPKYRESDIDPWSGEGTNHRSNGAGQWSKLFRFGAKPAVFDHR
jgi:hypothetical protein